MLLYRYFSDPQFVLDLLLTGELRASKPSSFNDPFDSRLRTTSDFLKNCPKEHISAEAFKKAFEKQNIPIEQIDPRRRILFGKLLQDEEFRMRYYELTKSKTESSPEFLATASDNSKRIICFSQTTDEGVDRWCDVLLWAHYAGGHRGIRVGFDFERKPPPGLFFEMTYQTQDLYWNGSRKEFPERLAQKGLVWSYERETRLMVSKEEFQSRKIIKYDTDTGLPYELDIDYITISLATIRSIDFGVYCDEAMCAKIARVVRNLGLHHIRLSRMGLVDHEYMLQPEPYTEHPNDESDLILFEPRRRLPMAVTTGDNGKPEKEVLIDFLERASYGWPFDLFPQMGIASAIYEALQLEWFRCFSCHPSCPSLGWLQIEGLNASGYEALELYRQELKTSPSSRDKPRTAFPSQATLQSDINLFLLSPLGRKYIPANENDADQLRMRPEITQRPFLTTR